jgi:predicted phosphoribosyltransferase
MTLFTDRSDAGKRLAEELSRYEGISDGVVLALPRGGVPVGFEVAKAFQAELDVYVVRKLGVVGREELAMGAIASGGVVVWNEDILREIDVPRTVKDMVLAREREELTWRESVYRGNRPPIKIEGKTVILVDDGLATGASMRAAVAAVRSLQPSRIVVAVPVGPPETCESFKTIADQVVCLTTPQPFSAISLWYVDFSQTTDEEVRELLDQAKTLWMSGPGRYETGGAHEHEAWITS